jgi:hypothetical protein
MLNFFMLCRAFIPTTQSVTKPRSVMEEFAEGEARAQMTEPEVLLLAAE